MAIQIQFRRDTAANWTSNNPILAAGELGLEIDTDTFKIGDGTTAWADLRYGGLETYNNLNLTGIPTAPTAAQGTNTVQIATTAYVQRSQGVANKYTDDSISVFTYSVNNTISTLQGQVTGIDTLLSNVSGTLTDLGHSTTNAVSDLNTSITNHSSATTSVHGIANTALLATKSYADSAVSTHNSATLNVHGIANTALLATTSDLALKAPLANATLTGTVVLPATTSIGNVSATEISYLDNVTSSIQTQIDAKAPIDSPTFTGTVSGITKAMVGLNNVNNTADASKPISTATQTALDLKAPLANATLTGTVVLPETTSIGNVSATEISYVDGVTSAIQTQIDSKLASSTASSTYAPIASPTFTGTVNGITKSMVGLANVDNTSDVNKPISTATQAALDLKAPLANAAFTGTVTGITKAMVGLGNVDNTTDANKPISTATQAALDLKAPLANATLTGTVVLPATTSIGTTTSTELGYVHGVTSAIQTQINTKAPSESATLANATFTGSVTGLTKSNVGLANVDNTSDVNKPISTATQAALDLKAPIANATFTGTLTVPTISATDLTTANLTVTGTTTTVNSTNLAIADSIIYLADTQYAADAVDIGFYGAYGTTGGNIGNHKHTGLVRDHLDGVFKLFYNGTEPANTTVDLTTVTYADLKLGNLVASGATIGSTTDTEIGYVHGVTSAIQTQLDAKAPKESPSLANVTVTGSLTLPTGVITSAAILDGTIVNADISGTAAITYGKLSLANSVVNADINTAAAISYSKLNLSASIVNADVSGTAAIAYSKLNVANSITNADINTSAAIAASKISGTAVTQADTGTVTSTMILDGTIVNADINASAAIAPTKISGTAVTQADSGTITSAMILDGTIVNGDISATAAIAVSKLAASTISGVTLGSNLNALTIGTGLTGTSYNGSAANTVAIDTTVVATLSNTQTLTNKTLTSPALTTPTVSSGTLTVAAAGITFSDGTVQTVAAAPSLTTISQKTASYTLAALTERDSMIEIANASATTITVPLDSTLNFPIGTTIDILQTGAGQVTITPATVGVTINATPGLKLRTQWSSATLLKRAANTWVAFGDLTA